MRVLIVDDEQAFAEPLAQRLELRGIEAAVAGDAETALDMLSRQEWDLVFLDVCLPGMDGVSLLKLLQEHEPRPDVVMLSGATEMSQAVKAMRRGALNWLAKPVSLDAVLEECRKARERADARRQARRLAEEARLRSLGRIAVGLAYTYVGLVLFLTGANVGFMPAGNYLGQVLAGQSFRWIIIPIGMLIGYFIVKAEPAVYVLNKQVEEVTDGAISARAMGTALSAGVSISVGLAMVRVLTGISILWFLIPGYAVAIGIAFVVPKLFTAIAFDAGGVASGPMTATFLLPLAQGACAAVGGNIVTDAFGVVAMVAMTPLITVQLMGLAAQLRTRKARPAQPAAVGAAAFADWPDDAIIEL